MPAVQSVLVVGSGTAGTATAVRLAEAGVSVDLVEATPDVTTLGSGITLQGNALRVLSQLGVWPEVERASYAFETIGERAPDSAGTLMDDLIEIKSGGPDLPLGIGILRPELARILVDRAAAAGTKVRFDTKLVGLTQDAEGVDVEFSDGSTGRYDLVVGADGTRSTTRSLVGIQLETQPIGLEIWRVLTPRPPEVNRTEIFYGGQSAIAGYTPTGENSLYAFVVCHEQDRSNLDALGQLAVMQDLAAAYHGPWDTIREYMTDPTTVNYTRYSTHFLDVPWHRGRVVLIGDAAHVCPPTIAQGAAMALEDGAVLAEFLIDAQALDEGVWDAFYARRVDRVRAVCDGSVQIARWQLERQVGDVHSVMLHVMATVAQPA